MSRPLKYRYINNSPGATPRRYTPAQRRLALFSERAPRCFYAGGVIMSVCKVRGEGARQHSELQGACDCAHGALCWAHGKRPLRTSAANSTLAFSAWQCAWAGHPSGGQGEGHRRSWPLVVGAAHSAPRPWAPEGSSISSPISPLAHTDSPS